MEVGAAELRLAELMEFTRWVTLSLLALCLWIARGLVSDVKQLRLRVNVHAQRLHKLDGKLDEEE